MPQTSPIYIRGTSWLVVPFFSGRIPGRCLPLDQVGKVGFVAPGDEPVQQLGVERGRILPRTDEPADVTQDSGNV
jgi:hypothetical protein